MQRCKEAFTHKWLKKIKKRVDEITASLPYYVYVNGKQVIGFAYAGKWKGRCAYRFSAESSIYLRHDMHGKGIGTILYTALINDLRDKNYHAVIGGIALPNKKSRHLHEKLGFKKVAHFAEVGYKFDMWIDVGYWELILK